MFEFFEKLTLSHQRPLEERRFLLGGSISCVAIIFVIINAIITEQGRWFTIGLGMALLLMIGLIIFTLKTKQVTIGSHLLIIIVNLVILPVGFPLGGGTYSGAPLWMLVGVTFVFLFFKGFAFWLYLTLSLIAMGLSYYLCYLHPDWVVQLQEGYSAHLDSYIAIICAGLIVGGLFKFQSMILTKEIGRAEQQAEEIEKLSQTQSSFFSSMSHEIRTPINTIIGLNEMTMREKNLSPEVLENTLSIQNASKMLLTLINDLLDMSKIQSGKMEIVPVKYDTGLMLSELTNFHLRRATEKELGFDIQVDENVPPMLFGDETRVKQVITNLLTNAIKYTKEGTVTLRFGGEQAEPGWYLLRVEVEDTGIGIRKEDIPYLFDSFRRVESQDTVNIEGTGLGLSISKELVEMMGGTISVDSIYTRGSTFRVEIPQMIAQGSSGSIRKPLAIGRQQPEYQQSFEAPRATVLIVDDNEMNRIVCRKLLRATKVQVDMAESGRACLELTHSKHYDAIFMDHEMPGMSGIEALRGIRQQVGGLCRETPVVALTANAGAGWDAFYLEQGFSAYLSKPIQSSQLEALLLACLPADLVEQQYKNPEEANARIYETISKRPFVVTTDSLADLPEALIREHEILVIPCYVQTVKGRFKDIEEIDTSNLRQYLAASGDNSVHSVPATVEEYEHFFGDALSENKFVFHLSGSQTISQAYHNALEASRSFDNVWVVDAGHVSVALGMMAIRAEELLRSGLQPEAVISELATYRKKIRSYFLVPSLMKGQSKYKAGFFTKLVTGVFNLDPVFETRKGKLRIHKYITAYMRSSADQFVKDYLEDPMNAKRQRLYVIFSGCSAQEREHILQEIEQYARFDEVIAQQASAATFIDCGSGAIDLVYEVE